MIAEYLRYTIPVDQQDAFIADYTEAKVPLMRSPFCTSFELCQCAEDPSQFILRIGWTSPDDHMKGFRGSVEFKEFLGHIRQYIPAIDEMRHYNIVIND